MRPVHLTFQGFTCFKSEQEIDFSTFDLFAITGPTGAGKSSILDAMIFALYGKVPRLGKHGIVGMVSHGHDRASVRLDFRVGLQIFRVVRTIHRNGPARVLLEEISNGIERPLADRIKDVDEHIERIVGLPYDVFIQAVVLPQGEFARFLQSTPGERQKIIQDLLRLHIYTRMRELASARSQKFEVEVRGLKQRLAEDFANATRENLEIIDSLLKEGEKRAAELNEQVSKVHQEFEEIRGRHQRSKELHAAREILHVIEEQTQEIEATRILIAKAQQAALLAPLVEAAKQAAAVTAAEKQAYLQAEMEAKNVAAEHKHGEEALERAKKHAEELPYWRERIQRLTALEGTIRALEAAKKRLDDAHLEFEKRHGQLISAERELKEVTERAFALAQEAEAAGGRLQAITYDAQLDQLLENFREQATELAALRQQMIRAEKETKQLLREANAARAEVAESQGILERVSKRAIVLRREIKSHEKTLEAAKREHAASHLRSGLKRGQVCPVCGQRVARIPPRLKLPVFGRLESDLQKLRAELEVAAEKEKNIAGEVGRLRGEASRADQQSIRYRKDAESARRRILQLEKHLENRVGSPVKQNQKPTIEQRIVAAAKEIASTREAFRMCEAALGKVIAEKARADSRRENTDTKVVGCKELEESAQREISNISDEIEGLLREIRAVTIRSDPEVEKAELEGLVKEIEQRLRTLEKRDADTRALLAQATEKQTQVAAVAQKAAANERRALEQAEAAATKAGFESIEQAAGAFRNESEILQLQRRVESYDKSWTEARSTVKRLEEAVSGILVTDAELAAFQGTVIVVESQAREATTNVGVLLQRRAQIVDQIYKAHELSAKLEEVQRNYSTYVRLQEDLRADRFQSFVLEESVRDLMDGASARLMQLTNRYTMELGEERDFLVIDHDNAMERRSVYTLSGGETFMASLALALELSEQIQRSANAVVLESLFIDEGFGTLDSEVLEQVASTIELLQAGGRMVGIITHISELAARMPSRLEIERRADGSRILSLVN